MLLLFLFFMDSRGRFGQASTEYLVIAAVVIIIALVVVSTVGGFSTTSASVSERESLAYWSGSDVGLSKPIFGNSSGGKVLARNNKPFSIRVLNITDSNGILLSSSSNLNKVLAPGETVDIRSSTSGYPCNGSSIGNTYSVNVVIFYADAAISSNVYRFAGDRPLVGTCMGSGGGPTPSPVPVVSLSAPADNYWAYPGSVSFQFVPTDDLGFISAALWTNYSGSWASSQVNTSAVSNNSVNTIAFSMTTLGTYAWNVRVCDNESVVQCSFALADRVASVGSTAGFTGFLSAYSANYGLYSGAFSSAGGNASSTDYSLSQSFGSNQPAGDVASSTDYSLYPGPEYSR